MGASCKQVFSKYSYVSKIIRDSVIFNRQKHKKSQN